MRRFKVKTQSINKNKGEKPNESYHESNPKHCKIL